MTHEAGKGDKMRPTDHEKFSANFDRIFGNRPEPYQIVCERCNKEIWVDPLDVYSHTHYCTPKENKDA